ncbi:MAG: hypothetical protein ABL890_05015 [Candidatus Peribacteraceae bacterium]
MLQIFRIILGVLLVLVGLFALVTPLTPGAWLGLIGLEMLGLGFIIPKRIRNLWKKKEKLPEAEVVKS